MAESSAASELTDDERALLDFEARPWTQKGTKWARLGTKEQAIRDEFGLRPIGYYGRLNALIGRPEAEAYRPLLVRRLRALVAASAHGRARNVTDDEEDPDAGGAMDG